MLSGYAQLHRVGEPDFDTGFSPDHFANMLKVLSRNTSSYRARAFGNHFNRNTQMSHYQETPKTYPATQPVD
jgi:hypothetical protein